MPRRNGSGPFGDGPMTGRGMGNCTGERPSNFIGRLGRGFGRGYGRSYQNSGNDNSLMSTILEKLEKLESMFKKDE